jgi:hypothetical protein
MNDPAAMGVFKINFYIIKHTDQKTLQSLEKREI